MPPNINDAPIYVNDFDKATPSKGAPTNANPSNNAPASICPKPYIHNHFDRFQ